MTGKRAARAAARRRPARCSPSAATTAPRSRRSPPAPASASRSSTSTSAARRASTPSSSTARSRLLQRFVAALSGGDPAAAARAGRAGPARLRRGATPTASGSWCATRPVADGAGGTSPTDHERRRQPGRADPRPRVHRPGPRPPSSPPLYSQALVGMVALVGQWWLDAAHARSATSSPRTWSTWPGTACRTSDARSREPARGLRAAGRPADGTDRSDLLGQLQPGLLDRLLGQHRAQLGVERSTRSWSAADSAIAACSCRLPCRSQPIPPLHLGSSFFAARVSPVAPAAPAAAGGRRRAARRTRSLRGTPRPRPAAPAACRRPSARPSWSVTRSRKHRSWLTTSERARPAVEHVLERGQRVDVEVVRRLVEQQHVGLAHQQPQQLQPAALAAGQVADPRPLGVAGEAEPLAQRGGPDRLAAPGRPAARPARRPPAPAASGRARRPPATGRPA